ncbi:MAG: LptF/LptG family permease [Bryobacteraceae bacterium]
MILARYIFREVVSSAFLGALLATFVIFLQGLGRLFELLVRSADKPEAILRLFLLALPPVLPLTIPFGVLVGILIGLGRMASDGEITAMRAAGIPGRKVILPVVCFSSLAIVLAGAASLWLSPWSIRETFRLANKLAADHLTAEIQPRIFAEQFSNSNTILYLGDVQVRGQQVLWKNVFIADLTPPEQRRSGLKEKADGPLITIAREAIAVPEPQNNRIRLSLRDASTHEVSKDALAHDSQFPVGDQTLSANPPATQQARAFREMDTRDLPAHGYGPKAGPNWVDARVELHYRIALPFGCLTLALVGIPLGLGSRRGGKSSGYVTAIFLAFFCYYLALISLMNMARQKNLSAEVAMWLPNAVFALAGLALLMRMERAAGRDWLNDLREWGIRVYHSVRAGVPAPSTGAGWRLVLMPQIVDTYVLTQFLYYIGILLVTFVGMTQIYTFFELLSDIVKNQIPMAKVVTYHVFLTPKLIYDTLPISVLVATLVTFGVLTKQNEVTAFKACGISLYRLSLPVLFSSTVLSAGLFAFDHYYIPQANRTQDAIRNQIKGRAEQTYLRPDRKWIYGRGSRIYYYRYFDTAENVMAGVNVFELEPKSFRLRRQISCERAEWKPALGTWIFQNGWRRDIGSFSKDNFEQFQATTFPELTEPPSYFLKEVKQDKQMNFRELETYIRDLQQSGFDTVKFQVQYYKKFSVPLFALIMAMIAVPFSFLVGNRGAMAGIGVSIGIAISYWAVDKLFEQVGNVGHLPPTIAAWSPDAVFALGALYLYLKMRS